VSTNPTGSWKILHGRINLAVGRVRVRVAPLVTRVARCARASSFRRDRACAFVRSCVRACVRAAGSRGGLEMLFGNQKKIDLAVPVDSSGSPVSMRQVLAHLKVPAFWLSVASATVPVCTSACARVAAFVSRVHVFCAPALVRLCAICCAAFEVGLRSRFWGEKCDPPLRACTTGTAPERAS